jgi:hypothetical protein
VRIRGRDLGLLKKRRRRRVELSDHIIKEITRLKNKKGTDASENKKPSLKKQCFRQLPLSGRPGEVYKAGTTLFWHGHLYELKEDVVIPYSGDAYALFERKI